jgi:hypothetical protein
MKAADRHPLDEEGIDRLWIAAAAAVGLRVERTSEAYASSDGRGTLTIGAPETLDPEDSLAQLVFHELCHALCQGEENLHTPDWGLDNTSDRDLEAEHACLRLQAHLADRFALRALMAPTTISRAYYDQLPAFPLEGSSRAAVMARRGARWAGEDPWHPALEGALAGTAAAVAAAARWAPGGRHPLGGTLRDGERCGGCAWSYPAQTGGLRCRQWAGPDGNGHRIDPRFPACARWEPPLDCRACAACCREGFDRVTVAVREVVVWRHPPLVQRHGARFELARAGGRCAALEEGEGRFTCRIHSDRPTACREVSPGDRRCMTARRRVGLGAG